MCPRGEKRANKFVEAITSWLTILISLLKNLIDFNVINPCHGEAADPTMFQGQCATFANLYSKSYEFQERAS